MKKLVSIFLVVLMLFSLSTVAFAAELGDINKPGTSGSEGPFDTSTFGGFLNSIIQAIVKNIKSISAEEMLKVPANAMADIMTLLFQVLQIFGKVFSAIGITG